MTATILDGKKFSAEIRGELKIEAQKLKEMVENRLTAVESLIAELSPALGVHTGPGTTGVCYFPVVE